MRMRIATVAALSGVIATIAMLQGQAPSPARVVDAAAEALGGKSRLMALQTMTITGYGQIGQQNGGGNIDSQPFAPQKLTNISGSVRNIDLANGRMRLAQTLSQDFVFAYERNMRGIRNDQRLDGAIAFNIVNGRPQRLGDAAVRARRLEMLNNPLALVRAALDPAARLSNLRADRATGTDVVDLMTAQGDALTVAFDSTTKLPAWVSWVQPDTNLGETTVRTYYSAYQAEKGMQVPFGYTSVIDWRNVVTWRFYVDRVQLDEPFDDIAAPAEVRAAAAPAPAAPEIGVQEVAKGIWYLTGAGNSTAFEFSDHITLYEVYASEANARAIIAKARTLVPGKPVTEAIVSHHHFDHSGGLRAAVGEGLSIITQRGNAAIFTEMASRPTRSFPDFLGRNPKPIKIIPVDERLVLKDAAMEVVVLRARNNSHMANAVIAYAPSAKTVSQGDMVDENWDLVYWGNSYPETVNFYKLDVERDLAVHGKINTYQDAIGHLRRQAANAKAFCDKAAAAQFSVPGCPITNIGF